MKHDIVSYGTLARRVGYGAPAELGQNTVSWLEDGELQHLAEPAWLAFLAAFNLDDNTMPGSLMPRELVAIIVEASQADPGTERPWTYQDSLDELTAAAMTKMHAEITQLTTAPLVVDAIMGRCSPIVQRLALDAYNLDR